MILYNIYETSFRNQSGKYHSRALTLKSHGTEEIVNRMLEGGSTVTKSDIFAVLNDMKRAIQNTIANGERVNIEGFCQFYPLVQGTFEDRYDTFDPSRHKLDVGVKVSSEFKEPIMKAKVEKFRLPKNAPEIFDFNDFKTGESNSRIFPLVIGSLKGRILKLDPETEDEGLFLQNMSDLSYHKVEMISKNNPSELMFLCPAEIAEGVPYRFELRNRVKKLGKLFVTRFFIELTGALN
ncbi:MAG: DUF4469 domain-containing protein [Leptospiraceae bacterium]|nr:DUF4469 domain-containing protein [Leptospiraceae bacterium]MCP5502909.1 DUF4469 domain-containing protein [Leptospiraceae bacterium]